MNFSNNRTRRPDPLTILTMQFIGKGLATLAYSPLNKLILLQRTDKLAASPLNFCVLQHLIDQYDTNGFTSLFSGSLIKILTGLPLELFNAYYKQLVFNKTNLVDPKANFFLRLSNWLLTGLVYDGGMLLLQTPIEVISTRLALGFEGSTLDLINNIIEKDGIKGFYRGFQDLLFGKCLETLFGFLFVEIFQKLHVRNPVHILGAQTGLEILSNTIKYPYSTLAVSRIMRIPVPGTLEFNEVLSNIGQFYGGFWFDFLLSSTPGLLNFGVNLIFSN